MRQRTHSKSTPLFSRNRFRSLLVQQLERREVFSVSATFDAGVVTVHGDDQANEIAVFAEPAQNKLYVKADGVLFQFPNEAVRRIRVAAEAGNDTIYIANNVRQTTELSGGLGNDSIFGSAQEDLILGGDGDDRLVGNQGVDRIVAGAGNDRIEGGEGADFLYGGLGNDGMAGGPRE